MTDQHPQFGFADEARRYRLESRIATGGMGEVWRATDTVLGRSVAVKLLKTEYADNASFRSRFETEARHAASLHHPGVAAVYDFGEASTADGSGVHRPFLVMELVDGQPLSALLHPGQPLDPDATRDLLAQAADALGAAHAAGIVHRDVKPANLLVTPDRQVKITDFGIARAAEAIALTETGQVMGTPQYLSPEQAEGKTATPASDVYSLGVVAFECLAGRRPFVAETAIATALAHLREPVPELPAEVPGDLAAVVQRSLSKSPAERFPDAAAFAAALRDPATAATALVPPAAAATQVFGAGAPTAMGAAAAAAPVPVLAPTPVTAPVPPSGPGSGLGGASGSAPGSPGDRTRRLLPWVLLLAGLVAVAAIVFALTAGDADDPVDEPGQPTRSGRPNAPSSTAPPNSSPEPSGPASSAKPSRRPSATASARPSETAEPSPSATVSEPPSASPTTAAPSTPASSPPAATPSPTATQSPASSSSGPPASPAPSAAPGAAAGARPAPSTSPGTSPNAPPSASPRSSSESGKVTPR